MIPAFAPTDFELCRTNSRRINARLREFGDRRLVAQERSLRVGTVKDLPAWSMPVVTKLMKHRDKTRVGDFDPHEVRVLREELPRALKVLAGERVWVYVHARDALELDMRRLDGVVRLDMDDCARVWLRFLVPRKSWVASWSSRIYCRAIGARGIAWPTWQVCGSRSFATSGPRVRSFWVRATTRDKRVCGDAVWGPRAGLAPGPLSGRPWGRGHFSVRRCPHRSHKRSISGPGGGSCGAKVYPAGGPASRSAPGREACGPKSGPARLRYSILRGDGQSSNRDVLPGMSP